MILDANKVRMVIGALQCKKRKLMVEKDIFPNLHSAEEFHKVVNLQIEFQKELKSYEPK